MDTSSVMNPNVPSASSPSTQEQSNALNQSIPVYKPIPIVVSSLSSTVNEDIPYTCLNSPDVILTGSPAGIVALDHNYALPPLSVESSLLKPITKPSNVALDDSKLIKPQKHDKSEKAAKIIKKEKVNVPQTEEQYQSGSTKYIFLIKPELPPKVTSIPHRSSIFLSNMKSSVFPASPTMSKLEHLLKNPVRSPSSRRSPSSFLSPSLNYHRCKNLTGSVSSVLASFEKENDVDIDVESVDPDPPVYYDNNRAKNLMKECEKNVNFLRQTDVSEDWEEQIVKTGWTDSQRDIFEKVLKALHQDRLSRLSIQNLPGEPVLRRLSIDKTAQRVRSILAIYKWDSRLTQWLHGVFVESLSFDYLSAYLDVLQTLRVKFPDLVDKMIILTTGPSCDPLPISPLILASTENSDTFKRNLNAEAISLVLKRKWDPFSSTLQQNKTKKLPSSPIFVIVATNPVKSHFTSNKRKKNFMSLLAGRGKVVSVTLTLTSQVCIRMQFYLRRLLRIASERIRDLKRQFPDRPIFAVGWISSAILAFRLSTIEPVAGVIALGFRMRGLFRKGCLTLNLLRVNCPSLFIVGGFTNYSSLLEMEILRQGMSCMASLLVIGCANDELCVKSSFRKRLLITQSYVDKSVVDEIVKFSSTCPVPVPSPEEKALSIAIGAAKAKKKVSKPPIPPVGNTTGHFTESGPNVKIENENEKSEGSYSSKHFEQDISDATEFDFDGPIMIPSNTSSNKRKAYYRPAPSTISTPEKSSTSPACITASQLVQQNPGVKRFSKPSGPNIPKQKPQVSSQPPPNSLIQGDHCLQMKLQSPLVSPNTTVEQEPISKPLLFNLVSTSTKMLRIQREPEKAPPSDIPAPTRFLFAVEESVPSSSSIVVDAGVKPYLPQPVVLPVQNKQIKTDEYEHSGFKRDKVEPTVTQLRPKLLSSTPIITTPTILPGGATATPFIRTSLPTTTPSQNKFSSHLFRLLTPSNESINRKAALQEIPKPTRVTEDLTANVSSPHRLTPNVHNEAHKMNSAGDGKGDINNSPKETESLVTAAPVTALKTTVANSGLPVLKLPRVDQSSAYVLSNQLSVSKFLSTKQTSEEAQLTSTAIKSSISLVKPDLKEKITTFGTEFPNSEKRNNSNLAPKSIENNEKEEQTISSPEVSIVHSGGGEDVPLGHATSDDRKSKVVSLAPSSNQHKVTLAKEPRNDNECEEKMEPKAHDKVLDVKPIQTKEEDLNLHLKQKSEQKSIEESVKNDCKSPEVEILKVHKAESKQNENASQEKVQDPSLQVEEKSSLLADKVLTSKASIPKSAKTVLSKDKGKASTLKNKERASTILKDKEKVSTVENDKEKASVLLKDKEKSSPAFKSKEKATALKDKEKASTPLTDKEKASTPLKEKEKSTTLKVKQTLKDNEKAVSTLDDSDKTSTLKGKEKDLVLTEREKHDDSDPKKSPKLSKPCQEAKSSKIKKLTPAPMGSKASPRFVGNLAARKTRNESRTIEDKPVDINIHSKIKKRNNSGSPKTIQNKNVERERLRSADKEKPGKSISNDGKLTKRDSLKCLKRSESSCKSSDLPKKLARRCSVPTSDNSSKKLKESSPMSVNIAMKTATEIAMKSTKLFEKDDTSVRKRSSPSSSKSSDIILSPASRTRNRSGNAAASSSISRKSNPHILRKKSRMTYTEESNSDTSDSSIEIVDEIRRKQAVKGGKRPQNRKEESSSSSSPESEDSFEEGVNEDKEAAPRVTRSMRRQSVPDSIGNDTCQSSDIREHENEKRAVKESEVNAVEKHSSTDSRTEKVKESRERKSSGSVCNSSGDDEDLDIRKRTKPIHPVTPASLSVTRTRKISIPNYFAYGM